MRFLAFFLCFFLTVLPAMAATTSVHPVLDKDKKLTFCLAKTPYEDGREMTLALSKAEEINLGFQIPKAGFKAGSHYDVMLHLAPDMSRMVRARALSPDTLLLQMGANPLLRGQLEATQNIGLAAGKKTISFDLPEMKKLFVTMDKCLGKKPAPVKEEAEEKEEPKEEPPLPDEIKDLLIKAGLEPFEQVKMNDIPPEERPADFLWQTGNILGGLKEIQAPRNKILSELMGLHLAGLRSKCDGKFTAHLDKGKTTNLLHLRTASATCTPVQTKEEAQRKKKPTIVVGLLFSLSKSHLFTVLTHEGFKEDEPEILRARNKILQVLLRESARNSEKEE